MSGLGALGLVVTHIFVRIRAQRACIRKPGAERPLGDASPWVMTYREIKPQRGATLAIEDCCAPLGLGFPHVPDPGRRVAMPRSARGYRISALWAGARLVETKGAGYSMVTGEQRGQATLR